MRELFLVRAVAIGDIEVVEVCRIVDAVDKAIGFLRHVDEMHGPFARRHRRRASRRQVDAVELRRALHTGFEIQRASAFGPAQLRRDQVDAVGGEFRRRPAGCRREPDLRMRFFRHRAQECEGLAVGRPPRRRVAGGVVRNLRQRSAGGIDHPDVRVVAVVEGLAGAVGDEGDLPAVGRPLWIGVVPVVARRQLRRAARLDVDHPQVRALVIEPAGVVELVVRVQVVAHIARRLCRVARTAAADRDQLRAVGRPLKAGDAVQEVRHAVRLASRQRQQPHLGARIVVAGRRPRRQKRDRPAVGTPARAVRGSHGVGQRDGLVRSVGRNRIDRAPPAVLLLVDARDHERDRRSVGRKMRIAERFERVVILGRGAPRLRVHRGGQSKSNRQKCTRYGHGFHDGSWT